MRAFSYFRQALTGNSQHDQAQIFHGISDGIILDDAMTGA